MTKEDIEHKKYVLEGWKTFFAGIAALTPFVVLFVGMSFNKGQEEQKQILQMAQLREQNIDLIYKIVPEVVDKGDARNTIMMRLLMKLDTGIANEIQHTLIRTVKISTLSNDTAKTDDLVQAAKTIGGAVGDTVKSIAAKDYEKKALESLVKKDVNGAITNFSKADISYPSYHNAGEMSTLLSDNRALLKDTSSKHWQKIYTKVLHDYAWQLPDRYKKILIYRSEEKKWYPK